MSTLEPFENLDRLALVSMRMRGLPPAVSPQLYEAARKSGEPLSYRAASALLEPHVARVALVTGIVAGPLKLGEADGPIGAAVLASALNAVGRVADVVVPAPMLPVVEGIRSALGTSFRIVADSDTDHRSYDAAVTIERLGRNRKGVWHWIFGGRLDDYGSPADDLIEAMYAAGKTTIGIGDGGNEIGFGAVFDEVRAFVPGGATCKCPCGDGIVTSTATKIVIAASVSNVGAYALASAIGILAGMPLLLPSPERVGAALEASVARGCIDGGTMEAGRLLDDSVPLDSMKALVTLFRSIATQGFTVSPRRA
jgi:hypothetical protein